MKITARCHPAYAELLPPPVPAARTLPEWLRTMPSEAHADSLGAEVRTLKHCVPMIEAFSAGVIIPLPTDIEVTEEGLRWDWTPPHVADSLQPAGPIGAHLPEQAAGVPFAPEELVVKFTNYWTFGTDPGWDLIYTHPFNREDLPFRTLTGRVSGHGFRHGFVNFPALWSDHGFRGTLPRGTPVAQVIPVPQEMTLEVGTHKDDETREVLAVHAALKEDRGAYRKRYHKK